MTHRTEQCCKECSGWEPALHECSCQCHYSPNDTSVVSPTIPERVEEFKKEFWKLSGDSVTELDRKQDEYVQNMLTETDQQARSEILEFIGRWKAETDTGSQEVDRLYLMLKALSNPPSQV